jgi:hypothetical protein
LEIEGDRNLIGVGNGEARFPTHAIGNLLNAQRACKQLRGGCSFDVKGEASLGTVMTVQPEP